MKKLSEWEQSSILDPEKFIQVYPKETIIKIDKIGNVNILVDGVAIGMMHSLSITAGVDNDKLGDVTSFSAVKISLEDDGDGGNKVVNTEYTDLESFLESLPTDTEEDGGDDVKGTS